MGGGRTVPDPLLLIRHVFSILITAVAVAPHCVAKEPFEGVMCTYQAQIRQDWIGDLGGSCFLLVVQRELRNDRNYDRSDASLGRGVSNATHSPQCRWVLVGLERRLFIYRTFDRLAARVVPQRGIKLHMTGIVSRNTGS